MHDEKLERGSVSERAAERAGPGTNRFRDGSRFDPADPDTYIQGVQLHHRRSASNRLGVMS